MNLRVICLSLAILTVGSGCPDDGGGAGGGISDFTRGFVFVRDRNIWAADEMIGYDRPVQLTTNGGNKHPSLSQDTASVVFVHEDAAGYSLQTVPMAGGDPATVLTSDANKTRFAHPVFSPDRSRIVFTFERGGYSILASVNADGSGFTELSPGTLSYRSPSFYPDGQHVLVAAGNTTSSPFTQLEKVNLSTRMPESVANPIDGALAVANRVVVNPAGTRAGFDAQTGSAGARVFVVDLDLPGGAVQLTEYLDAPSTSDSFPAWMGSNEVTFSSDYGGNDQVYKIGASQSSATGTLVLPAALEPWFGPN